ncbi:MAG TPA: beta-propeller fold lactonase family protein [Bacteroidales bacterium]|nr:beta-propeller fold lactonase family protein [Bacteroidales bacterium]
MKTILCAIFILLSFNQVGISQVTYRTRITDNMGGIEGLTYPEAAITDRSGKNLLVVANNGLTHFRNTDGSYTYIERIDGTTVDNYGLWNADKLVSTKDDRYIYVCGDNHLNIFKFDSVSQHISYLENIQNNSDVQIGYSGSSFTTLSRDNRNLYLATTYSTPELHIFKIDTSTGLLSLKKTVKNEFSAGEYFRTIRMDPSDSFLYVLSSNYYNEAKLRIFRRCRETDSLALIKEMGLNDSITNPYDFNVSPDGLNLYVIEENRIKIFEINRTTGLLNYIGQINSSTNGYSFFSWDPRYLYMASSTELSVLERNPENGILTLIQKMTAENTGFDWIKSITISSNDTLMYLSDKYINSIHILKRNPETGLVSYFKRIVDKQGKIYGFVEASDMVVTHDNKSLITLAMASPALMIFDRTNNDTLTLSYIIPNSYMGPAIGVAQRMSLSPDDKYLILTSTNMFGIRILQKNNSTGKYEFFASYTYEEAGVSSDQQLVQGLLSDDMKYFYAAKASGIYCFGIDSGKLTLKSSYAIHENSDNGLNFIRSMTLSADNKYLYTCSQSEFYPKGISVYSRNVYDGSLTFLQKIEGRYNKILISKDNQFAYTIGDEIKAFKIQPDGMLTFIEKHGIESLGYTEVYTLHDAIITEDQKAIIGVTNTGKAIISFYRNRNSGNLIFEQTRFFSDNMDYSNGIPLVRMSSDKKNVYVVSPYDASLTIYNANIPLGLPDITNICNDTAVISVDDDYASYEWSSGETAHGITTMLPGTYSVYVTDLLGRTGWDRTSVVFHDPFVVNISLWQPENSDPSLFAYADGGQSPFTYIWNDGSTGPEKYLQNSDIFQGNLFYVTVIDNVGCMASDTLIIDETSVGDSDFDKIILSPNPAGEFLYINFSGIAVSAIEITDNKGILVFNTLAENNEPSIRIETGSLNPGLYFVKLKSNNSCVIRKFLKL